MDQGYPVSIKIFKEKLRNNTATERYMMERHVVDMVRFWAIQHRIFGDEVGGSGKGDVLKSGSK